MTMAPACPGQWSGLYSPPEKTYMELTLLGWRKDPDKVAVIDVKSGEELTYRELEMKVRDFAGSLQKIGVRARSKVQFYANNSLNSLIAHQAALFCSATVFLFKQLSTKYAEYKFETDEADIEFVLTDAANYDVVVHTLLADPQCRVRQVIILSGVPKTSVPKAKVLHLHELPQGEFEPPKDVNIRDDVLFVMYTSGSTGRPKGVMHTHFSVAAGLAVMFALPVEVFKVTDRFLVVDSLTHMTGNMITGAVISYGGTLLLASHDMDAEVPTYIEKYQATLLTMLECPMKTLIDNAHRYPNSKQMLSSLRLTFIAGTAFPEYLRRKAKEFFSDSLFINVYGLTELFGTLACSPPSPEPTPHVGYLFPGCDVKVLNKKGDPVEVGELGELFCRGPRMTLGYWKREIDNDMSDGYYATGDLVTVDAAGNITIVDRKKHFMICLDARVSPLEIEDLLLNHPAIQEVVVVATPHPVVQDAPTAMVVLKTGHEKLGTHEQIRQEIINYVSTQCSDYKHLHGGVHFVESLDKTESGKYARAAITQRALKLSGSI